MIRIIYEIILIIPTLEIEELPLGSDVGHGDIMVPGSAMACKVVPTKKALKIGLSPCEARLCYENYVDVDSIQPLSKSP